MRLYEDYQGHQFKSRLDTAIKSIARNAKDYAGKVSVVLYDNSPDTDAYEAHREMVAEICEERGFSAERQNLWLFHTDACIGNSAYATYLVREETLRLIEKENDTGAVIVSLDQDDELEAGAIGRIASAMTEKGVVLSPFSIIKAGGKDITQDGGSIQQEITNEVSRNPIVNKDAQNLEQKNEKDLKDIVYASSMGWSKSYSYAVLKAYQDALRDCLESSRGGVAHYFDRHRAYEDFLDFFVLLLSDVTISATSQKTHIYNKYSDSITAKSALDDFRLHRTANLLALIDLCYMNQGSLRKDFKRLLLRYVTVKVVDIERILQGYRDDFLKGDSRYAIFEEATHENYFIRKLCRLASGDIRYGKEEQAQDEDLFLSAEPVRYQDTSSHFNDLFSCDNINSIKPYRVNLSCADSRQVLETAVLIEKEFRKEKKEEQNENERSIINKQKHEEDIAQRYDKKKTPNQKRLLIICIAVAFFFVFTVLFVLWAFGIFHFWETYRVNAAILPETIAFLVAILTFLLNEAGKVSLLAQEEESLKKLYFSEFEDLIRHLEANLKVMIEIRKQITDSTVPVSVHFDNLSWPDGSCLFSDEMSKIIDKRKVDDFARLKVNLRNLQNSASWLSSYVKENHSKEELCKAIDWEIARHFGYLINFHFLKNNNFQFATQSELDYYIKEKHLKEYLSTLFISYSGESSHVAGQPENYSRMDMVEKYLKLYNDDRRMRRNVLLTAKH